MGTEIDRLEIQIETQASKANRQLDELISKLGKLAGSLSSINSGGMKQFAAGMNGIASSAKNMSTVKSAEINRVVNNLQKLSGIKTGNMFNVGNALLSVSRGMQGLSGISGADIPAMVTSLSSLSKLGNKGIKSAAASMPMLAKNLQSMAATINGMNINPDIAAQLSAISSASKTFGHKSMKTAIENMPALSQGLKGLMQTLSIAPKMSANLVNLVNALSRLLATGGSVHTVVNAVQSVGQKSTNTAGGLQQLSNSLSRFAFNTDKAQKSMRSFSASISSLYANCFLLIRGFKAIGRAVESSMDYIETYNYYNVTMSKIASEFSDQWQRYGYESAEAYGDSFTTRLNELTRKMSGYTVGNDGVLSISGGQNLSLDPEQLMNYQSNVAAITNSVGLVGETSVNTAKALSMLAADMSSLKNIDMSTVMTNFQSGLIGQSRALYKYGIDITNATLQTYAYKYGVQTAVSEMTQADKMQLRLLAILDQSKVAWGDQANTINSVANQYRILKQQISNVGRIIGNLFIPIIQKALPVINGMLIAIQRLFMFIGNLIGIDWSGLMDGISGGYGGTDDAIGDLIDDTDAVVDEMDGIGDSLGDAEKKAKKLQRTLLGFDQINKLADNSDLYSDTESGSDIDSGKDGAVGGIDLSDAIGAALADYESIWDKALKNSQNKAQKYADAICNIFEEMWRMIQRGDYEELGKYIADGLNYVFERINAVFNWEKSGPEITKFVDGLCRTVNSLVDNIDWWNIGKAIGDGINVVTNTIYLYLTGIDWVNFGKKFAEGVNGLIDAIDWEKLGQTIGAKLMVLPKIAYGYIQEFDFFEFGKAIAKALNGVLTEIDLKIVGKTIGKTVTGICELFISFSSRFKWKKLGKSIAYGINAAFKSIDAKKFSEAINKLLNGWLDLFGTLIKKIKWSDIISTLGTILGRLDWWALTKTLISVKLIAFSGSLMKSLMSSISTTFKNFSLIGIAESIGKAFLALRSNDLVEGTDLLSKLADTFTLVKNGAGSLSEALALEFPKISGTVTGIRDVIKGVVDMLGGPFTVAITTIGAALIACVIGIRNEIDEAALDTVFDSLMENGVTSAETLATVFENTVSRVTVGVDTTKEKIDSISETKESIDGTVSNIQQISTAIENGAYTAEEKVPEIVEQFQSLLNQSKAIFEEEYAVIVGNMAGAWADYLEASGEAVPEAIADLAELRDKGKVAYDDIETSVRNLEEQFKNGEISAEDYYNQLIPLYEKMGGVNANGEVDNSIKSIEDFGGALDMSQYIDDGSFDTTKFQDFIDSVVGKAAEGKDNLETLGVENEKVITDWKGKLESWGVDASGFDWSKLYGASDDQVTQGKANIDAAYTNFSDQIQYCLMQQLPGVIEEATADYEKLNWWEKLFTTKDDYVRQAVDQWKNNIVFPASEALQTGMEELGIDGEEWGSQAAFKLINSLFDTVTTSSSEGVVVTTTSLKNDWKTILTDALDGAADAVDAAAYGKETIDGYNTGITDNADSSSDPIKKWMDGINTSIHDSAMDFGSPSKKAESYGKDTIDGYADGIEKNAETAYLAIKRCMDNISEMFNIDTTALYEAGKSAIQAFANGFESVYIKTPHIYTESYDTHFVGETSFSTPNFAVQWYANGGFPGNGELFFARESGPELVGRMGNKNAVANNDQITNGIANAVYPAVRDAVMEAMMTMGGLGGKSSQVPVIEITIKSGEETLYKAVRRGEEKYKQRYKAIVEI